VDDEAIQEGPPVTPAHPPADNADYPLDRVTWRTAEKDRQYLRVLSIFWYILAGLYAVVGVATGLYIYFGVMIVAGSVPTRGGASGPAVGYSLLGLGIGLLLFYGVYAYLAYLTARSLVEYRRWKFVFGMAVALCVLGGIPILVLGVFTIVVLSRDSVKAQFARGGPAYSPDEEN
jgi:hypothetical protein